MSKKKAFALRINEELLTAVEKWAADEFRSTNGQIEWMLSEFLKEYNRQPKSKKWRRGHFFYEHYFGILQS